MTDLRNIDNLTAHAISVRLTGGAIVSLQHMRLQFLMRYGSGTSPTADITGSLTVLT